MASEGVDGGSDEGKKFEWPIIGIDLGTTYSCVSVWRNNKPEVILNDINQRLTPSSVAFADGDLLVGEAAKNQITSNPQNTIYDVKRLIGRRFKDEIVQRDMKLWSFKVVEGSKGEPRIVVRYGKEDEEMQFAVHEISSKILKKLKEDAQDLLSVEVHNAVITVPAYFNDSQRRATEDAGKIAGLNVVRVINEPTAAALAYAQHEQHRGGTNKKKVLVFDLGGRTLDVSIVEMEGHKFNLKATSGDRHLGGEDFDNNMVDYLAQQFNKKSKIDILITGGDQKPLRRLRKEWEKVKRTLSSQKAVTIDIDSLSGEEDFVIRVTRQKFEQLNKVLFEKCLEPIDECLIAAGMAKEEIDEVLLVGGSTRIPKIREVLKKHFNGKEPCHTVNPDEAVACGAAIQGAILAKLEDPLIMHLKVMDVTPLSLGINDGAGRMSILVNRCTPIPISIPTTRCTYFDNQEEIKLEVYEGERPFVKDNHHLGDVVLKGISPAPAGKSVVDLIFDINEDGILTVTVKDKNCGKEASVTMTNDAGRLSDEDIQKMISDAEKWKAHDDLEKKRFYAKNELEARLNDMINRLSTKGTKDMMGSVTYNRIRAYAKDLKTWIDKEGKDASYEELKDHIKEMKRRQNMIKSSYVYITKINDAILSKVEDPLIMGLQVMDATPLSLGINDGGKMSCVVNRCTPIPIRVPTTRCTSFDNQTEMTFQVYEGERGLVEGNHHLGDVVLKGISPAPAGQSVVDLIFDIDEDGILTVTAKDREGGKEVSVTMTKDAGRLSDEQIQKMISDAERWQPHDDLVKRKLYAKNELEERLNDMTNKLSKNGMRERMGVVTYDNILSYATDLQTWIDKEVKDASYEELQNRIKELKKRQKMTWSSNDVNITKIRPFVASTTVRIEDEASKTTEVGRWRSVKDLVMKWIYVKNELKLHLSDMVNKLEKNSLELKMRMGVSTYGRIRAYATELNGWIEKEANDATYDHLQEKMKELKETQNNLSEKMTGSGTTPFGASTDAEPVIGIDFGTCNSCVAVWDIIETMIIPDDEGNRVIPSYIAFPKGDDDDDDDDADADADVEDEDDGVLVGNAAKSQMANNPFNTIFGLKRLVGRKFNDKRLQSYVRLWPFEVVEGEDNEPEIIVEHQKEKKQYKIQEILSMLLTNVKDLAEKTLNKKPIKGAIVTVPVHFGQSERAIIREAATQVGFNIDHFISEPTAAAVAYLDNYMSDEKANVLVFDLGGGTLDVSLLEMRKSIVEVRAVAGDPSLGGDDFDNRLIKHLIEIFRKKHNVDISSNKKSLGKLKAECEQAKLRLCAPNAVSTRVEIESLYKGMDFCETVELSSFNEMNKDLFDKCIEPVKKCLNKAKVMAKDVDEVILVGGSSRIQKIRELLQGFFPGKKLLDTLSPEEVVAKGAAMLGAKFSSGKEDDFLKEFNLTNNLTYVSIGIEMNDGSMEVVIQRNTQIPAEGVTTLDHNQCPMTLHVYAGDYETAKKNILLGTLTLPSITPTQKGDCAWEVTFFMDKNDAVHVKVKDTKSGIHREETFTEKLNLNEIAEMEKRNEKIRQENKMLQYKKEACNELKECVDSLSDKLKDEKSKMGDHYYDFVNRANSNAKAWLESEGLTAELAFIKKMKQDHKLIFNAFVRDIDLQPQEVVASGDAIVEPVVSSKASIGLRREDGSMKVIIPKDTNLPVRKVSTIYWNQHPATLFGYEGEKERTNDNRLLWELKLPELESIVTGGCIVEVTLTVDPNNGVQVTAKYYNSDEKPTATTISDNSGRLSTIEIDKMIEENEKMNLEQKTAQKKRVALNEIKDYVDLLTAKLKNENVREKFGKYKYDNLSIASSKAKAWLDNEGPNAELEDISKMEEYQEWIFKTFLK